MRAPRNTATQAGLAEVASRGTQGSPAAGNAIMTQERDGQESFVNSDTLPSQMSAKARTILEAAGVKFGGTVPGDDLFVYVELPAGWRKNGSSHAMHSSLLDGHGRTRASIFYKAAFYDRRAGLDINRRFGIMRDYDREDNEQLIVTRVFDCNNVVFTSEPRTFEGDQYHEGWKAAEQGALDDCKTWLASNGFPKWEDAGEYWD